MEQQQECPLTAREIEIAKHLADGHTAKVISEKTGLTEFSVTMQIKIARRVVGARNSTHFAAIALRKGWIA